jgi:hypothetical protein
MLLPLTDWVDYLNSRDDDQGKIHKSRQKHTKKNSLRDVVIFFVCSKLKVKLCTAINTVKSTESKCIVSHAQNTIL